MADRRILLREVCQSALERRIEGINAIGIIALAGQDNRFFLIFRKSGHCNGFPFIFGKRMPSFVFKRTAHGESIYDTFSCSVFRFKT